MFDHKFFKISLGIFLLTLISLKALDAYSNQAPKQQVEETKTEEIFIAEKLEIMYFHTTARCFSCSALEELTKKTLEAKFSSELSSGQIIFSSINIDLPDNKALAQEFQATGSSLFIKAILADGSNNKKPYLQVWQYLNNEEAFIEYLSQEINQLLGKN